MSRTAVIVGGGLAGCLLAWRLLRDDADYDLVVLERGDSLGGNHTWSFHGGDVGPEHHEWLAPLVACSWPRHSVRFPDLERGLESSYHSITSDRLHALLRDALGERLRLGVDVVSLDRRGATLGGGERIEADAVVDARGDPRSPHLALRFQKFLGQEVVLERAHGLDGPILMDATVPQTDGYRFVYVLPFTERRVLIEDTYYADGADLPEDRLRQSIADYAAAAGWGAIRVEREERGILPILLGGDFDRFWSDADPGVTRLGMQAAMFHATTGYSLPDTVHAVEALASRMPSAGADLDAFMRRFARAAWRRYRFFRMLNRMLFLAGEPHLRYRVLERFYGLPSPLIERFYAGRLGPTDKLRLVSGKPPVPLLDGLRAAFLIDARSRGQPR